MKKRVRLFNFLIDSVIFFIIVIIFSMLLKNYIARENLNYFMIALYYLYYLIFEYTTGQTIGKIITKTKVVIIDNDLKPSFSTILLRTLCRLIPFEIISYLFSVNGLHDRLSKTTLKNI